MFRSCFCSYTEAIPSHNVGKKVLVLYVGPGDFTGRGVTGPSIVSNSLVPSATAVGEIGLMD